MLEKCYYVIPWWFYLFLKACVFVIMSFSDDLKYIYERIYFRGIAFSCKISFIRGVPNVASETLSHDYIV